MFDFDSYYSGNGNSLLSNNVNNNVGSAPTMRRNTTGVLSSSYGGSMIGNGFPGSTHQRPPSQVASGQFLASHAVPPPTNAFAFGGSTGGSTSLQGIPSHELRGWMATMSADMAGLKKSQAEQAAELTAKVRQHETQIAALQGELKAQDKALGEKDARIVQLQRELEQRTAERDQAISQLHSLGVAPHVQPAAQGGASITTRATASAREDNDDDEGEMDDDDDAEAAEGTVTYPYCCCIKINSQQVSLMQSPAPPHWLLQRRQPSGPLSRLPSS